MAHKEAGPDELFVGNTLRDGDCLSRLRAGGMLTARLGEVALDIEGKPLSREHAPVLIGRSEAALYNDIMMTRTFGPDWRSRT